MQQGSYRVEDPILGAFAGLLEAAPGAVLVASPHRQATRGEVSAWARAATLVLDQAALTPDGLVGLSAQNGAGFLASFLALRARAHAVLLLDPQAPEAERREICSVLRAEAMLTCHGPWPQGPDSWTVSPISRDPVRLPGVGAVKLTSGSTGAARGVAVTPPALWADDAGLAASMGLLAEDRIVGAIPFSHSYGFASIVLPALIRGSLIGIPDQLGPLAPLAAAQHVSATVFPTAPAYLQALLKMSRPPAWPESVRLVISASAPLQPAAAARFREAYGQPVHVFYGASEVGGICYDRDGGAGERGTVGTPVEGVKVDLETLDGDDAAEGVIVVTSRAAGQGYLPEPDRRLGAGRFQSSDLATWRNGEIALLGRLDGLVNVKGKKVNPAEIEKTLLGLSGVEDVVALGVPAPERGGEMLRVVIASAPGRLAYEDVLAFCRARLADHKVPRSMILLSAIPRTARGKIDRRALLGLRETAEVRGE